MSLNPVFFDLCQLRNDNDIRSTVSSLHIDRASVRFTYGYNEGRNRRELLAMIDKVDATDFDAEFSFLSIRSMSHNSEENHITEEYLRLRRRKERMGRFVLDLRGTAIERHINRRFNDADLDMLFEFLSKRPGITGLHLAYNNLTNYGFEKLSNFLAEQPTIAYVNVMNNDITYLDKRKLAEDFEKWKVQCLNLRGNKIGQKGGKAIAYLLTKNTSIRHLALGETDQTVNSILSIADTLIQFGGNETLTKLDLTKTLVQTGTSELCRHLACVIEVNRSLVELVLSKNNISDLDLEIFLEGMKYHNNISRLNLSCNEISSIGAELIANILPKTNLKILVLATNRIGDSGAMAIGRTFSTTKVKYLDISTNDIGDLGMTHLVWAICRPMDGFLIFGNKFTEYTAKVIYSQILDLAIHPKILDIRLWFDNDGHIRYARRNLWSYSEWYYYVPEWRDKYVIRHCCCPIRGGIMIQLNSDD